jgi:hypothetical protein
MKQDAIFSYKIVTFRETDYFFVKKLLVFVKASHFS